MVPSHRPIPERKSSDKGLSILGAWVQAEKIVQIALLLPSAAFIGWLIGAWLDHILHQSWMAPAGIVLGIISGLVGAIEMAMAYAAEPQNGADAKEEKKDRNGNESGGSGAPS